MGQTLFLKLSMYLVHSKHCDTQHTTHVILTSVVLKLAYLNFTQTLELSEEELKAI